MKLFYALAFTFCSGAAFACGSPSSPQTPPTAPAPTMTATLPTPPPLSRVQDVVETHFEVEVHDPYRWLEDENSPEVKEWMRERDTYARKVLSALPERDDIAKRLTALVYVDSQSAPIKRGNRLFYTLRPANKEKGVKYYQEGENGTPQVYLDPNTLSEDGSVSIDGVVPSHDGQLVAYLEKQNNADESTLRVMTVATGELHPVDTISGLRYTGASWKPDSSGFYYTWLPNDPSIPEKERPGYAEIRFHQLGTPPSEDKTVREKTGDPTRWQSASLSRDGKYLFLYISRGWSETDVYVQLLGKKETKWRELAVGTKSLYMVTAFRDTLYVASNEDAPNYRVYAVSPAKLERKRWKEIVPEDPDAVLEDLDVLGGRLALNYLKQAHSELVVRELDGKLVRQVELPTVGSTTSLIGNDDEDTAYFSFSSFTYPEEIYKTSIDKGGRSLYAKLNVPVNPGDFEVTQRSYPSKDGTLISMFLVHKKGIVLDGKNPTLLHGYGGFNVSLTPYFNATLFPWLERGGVYALPNLRGGGEYGEDWHKAGMLQNKQNVFDDFIAAAEWLIKEKYTSPRHLAITGRSNGGLLVGAAMTQRPELYRAVVCGVPLLDMVRYDQFGMGQAWVPEYGDPTKERAFRYLYQYSPYHRLESGVHYPALLMASADTDDRVDPLHARKFVAKLEAVRGQDDSPTLLRIEENAGHGGADMRKKLVDRTADELAFLWSELHP